MLKVTTWSPDTCDCIINYSWDDSLKEDDRIHKVSEIVKPCSVHLGLDDISHYNAVLEENSRKNIAIGYITDTNPGTEISWSFDANRILILNVKNVSFFDPIPLIAKVGNKVQVNLV